MEAPYMLSRDFVPIGEDCACGPTSASRYVLWIEVENRRYRPPFGANKQEPNRRICRRITPTALMKSMT